MSNEVDVSLRAWRLLVVEDNYMIAADLAHALEDLGVEVVGPLGSVEDALTLLESDHGQLDGAILDVNLGNERVYPVADALMEYGLPFVFATGYNSRVLPAKYADVPRCEKPVDTKALTRVLADFRSK